MNKWISHCLILAAAITGLSIPTQADTWTCNAVDDKAALGYDGTSAVTVTTSNKQCDFSIGGASVDGKTIDFGSFDPNYQWQEFRRDMEILAYDEDEFFSRHFEKVLRFALNGLSDDDRDSIANALDGNLKLSCDATGLSPSFFDRSASCQKLTAERSLDGEFDLGVLQFQTNSSRYLISLPRGSSSDDRVLIFLPNLGDR